MQHHQDRFFGADGLSLYYQCWRPLTSAKAVMVIVHGLGGHSDLFSHVVDYFVPRDYVVYALDLRGHGRSAGQRGHIFAWQEFRDDLRLFLHCIRQQEALHLPLFLYGHSLGALISLDYLLQEPGAANGAIASAPPLGDVGVSPLRLSIGRLLSWIWPRFSLGTGLEPEIGSRDATVNHAYETDPLRHGRGTARLATEFLATVERLHAQASKLAVPLLILQGGEDKIAFPEGSRRFFANVAGSDKTLQEYPDAYHELHEDLNYLEVLQDVENWLDRHLSSLQRDNQVYNAPKPLESLG